MQLAFEHAHNNHDVPKKSVNFAAVINLLDKLNYSRSTVN